MSIGKKPTGINDLPRKFLTRSLLSDTQPPYEARQNGPLTALPRARRGRGLTTRAKCGRRERGRGQSLTY